MAELDLNSDSFNPCLLFVLFTKFALVFLLVFCLYKMGNEEKETSWKVNLSKEYNFSHFLSGSFRYII